jgi:hypothetical protein
MTREKASTPLTPDERASIIPSYVNSELAHELAGETVVEAARQLSFKALGLL